MQRLSTALSWCAGVLEAKAMFRLRATPDGSVIGADVLCYCPLQIATLLQEVIGGHYSTERSVWILSAQEQESGLTKILSHVRSKAVRRRISRVLLFRATQAGGGVSDEVKKFRRKLKEVGNEQF